MATNGDILQIEVKLDSEFFVHAVVVVQALYEDFNPAMHSNKNEYLQNFEIYIGNSPTAN